MQIRIAASSGVRKHCNFQSICINSTSRRTSDGTMYAFPPSLITRKSPLHCHIAHQLRVHLQYLGFPIANDPIYSESRIWGEKIGKGGVDIVPSDARSAPAPPPHLEELTKMGGSPESLRTYKDGQTNTKLLPRETGEDIGMGSPVPLSSEAVGVITRLRNMKVCRLMSSPKTTENKIKLTKKM